MPSELEYLATSKADKLYINPAKNGAGAYVNLIGDNEALLGEIDITSRSKLAVSAFYVRDKTDYDTFKLTKLKYHKTYGWQEDGHIHINKFQLVQMREFIAIITSLDLRESKKTRIALGDIHLGALGVLLTSSEGPALLKALAASPELHHDIYAVAAKRAALAEFKSHLASTLSEGEWQAFFEENTWIFGHGLIYVFLNKVGKKLESQTTGSTFDRPGKRVDGLMRTRAKVSQYILLEIKKNNTDLLRNSTYRPGCWGVSHELSDAVTQVQKSVLDFTRDRFRDNLKDEDGNDTGETVYSIEPRNFLVIGNLTQLSGNDDKVACFELYRRNIRSPEILTFDELYCRASCIIETLIEETGS
jgi:hypothetical protein